MKKISLILLLISVSSIYFIGCSDDDSPTKPKPTYLNVHVFDKSDTSVVNNSNVVVFDAETNQSVARKMTDLNGECTFELSSGNYYLVVSAQGYDPSPAPNVAPVPFFVTAHTTETQDRYLNENAVLNSGYIEGTVSPVVNNVLVVAENTINTDSRFGSFTGPDGYFVIYNVPYSSYKINIFKAGYTLSGTASATLSSTVQHQSVALSIVGYSGSSLSGSISFLATSDSMNVDVALKDPVTLQVIPGMLTREDGGDYSLDSIPDGNFLAWASYENDGYVLDPDWVFKNPGALDLTFPADNGSTLDFSLTGSVKIVSPTNPADSIYAFLADSTTPTFSWEAYSSAKEYIIEVRDVNGNIVWGGFTETGVVRHQQILKENLSIQYNYDGSATSDLVPGEIYQWKIYADDDTALNVQTLLSSSEDLRGIFQVPSLVSKK